MSHINIIQDAISDLQRGKFVMVYDGDGREEETDFVIASVFVTSHHIRTMRKDGGGLICMTITQKHADILSLPRLTDILHRYTSNNDVISSLLAKRLPYDTKSAFSITVNHKDCYTGITDKDRALTISTFGKIIGAKDNKKIITDFQRYFRAPGHVHILISADGLLRERKGHTELSTALMELSGLPLSACICEMMGDNGMALDKTKAIEYSNKHGLVFLEGEEIIRVWEKWSE